MASDLERYLLPTETPEVLVRRHWASLARPAALFAVIELVGFFVVSMLSDSQSMSVVGVLILLAGLARFGWAVGDWYHERFVITDRRVLLMTGLLSKRVAIMPLSKVTDLTYERSVTGRILGYGVFVMESAGQKQGLDRVEFLPTPDVLYQQVSALLFGPNSRLGRRYGPYGGDGGFDPDDGPGWRPTPRGPSDDRGPAGRDEPTRPEPTRQEPTRGMPGRSGTPVDPGAHAPYRVQEDSPTRMLPSEAEQWTIRLPRDD